MACKTTESKAEIKRNAIVTLVMGGNAYVKGALVLGRSIKKLLPDVDCVCIITSDVTMREKLEKYYTVILMEKVTKPTKKMTVKQEEYYASWKNDSFTKLTMLKLVQYKTLLFLDSDVILTDCEIKSLFDLKCPAGIFSNPWSNSQSNTYMVPEIEEKSVNKSISSASHSQRLATITSSDRIYKRKRELNHGETVSKEVISKAYNGKDKSFVCMGSSFVLEPSIERFDKMISILSKVDVFGNTNNMSSYDEQILYLIYDDVDWTNIGKEFNFFTGKYDWIYYSQINHPKAMSRMGVSKEIESICRNLYINSKKDVDKKLIHVLHYYGEKPWKQKKNLRRWFDLIPWWKLADQIVEEDPELLAFFENGE